MNSSAHASSWSWSSAKRLGGKQAHGARGAIGEQPAEHRQVVSQRLAAASGVTTTMLRPAWVCSNAAARCVYNRDAPGFEGRAQPKVNSRRDLGEGAVARRLVMNGAHGRVRILMHCSKAHDHGFERWRACNLEIPGEVRERE
jgi:hypothetical protein